MLLARSPHRALLLIPHIMALSTTMPTRLSLRRPFQPISRLLSLLLVWPCLWPLQSWCPTLVVADVRNDIVGFDHAHMQEDLYILTHIIYISYCNICQFPKWYYPFMNLTTCKPDYSNGVRARKTPLLERTTSIKEVLAPYNMDSVTDSIILTADLRLQDLLTQIVGSNHSALRALARLQRICHNLFAYKWRILITLICPFNRLFIYNLALSQCPCLQRVY